MKLFTIHCVPLYNKLKFISAKLKFDFIGLAWLGFVWFGFVLFEYILFCLDWFCFVWIYFVLFGLV